MFVWSILLAVIIQPRNDKGPVELRIQNNSPIQCLDYKIKREYTDTVNISSIRTVTCHMQEKCFYYFDDTPSNKRYEELARCMEYTAYRCDTTFYVWYNSENPPTYAYVCDTDFCNAKQGPTYEKLQKLHNFTIKTQELLDREEEKQGNATLFCLDEQRNSISCRSYCKIIIPSIWITLKRILLIAMGSHIIIFQKKRKRSVAKFGSQRMACKSKCLPIDSTTIATEKDPSWTTF